MQVNTAGANHKILAGCLSAYMGLTLFGWQFCTNLAHWLYGFRYWVIAQDISLILYGRPNSAGAEGTRRKERFYKFVEFIGTTISL